MKYLDPGREADLMLTLFKGWPECYAVLNGHYSVLQTRNQMMLALATLTLTITGFSGPKIAADNAVSRYALVAGLCLVLASVVLILVSSMRIRWLTSEGVQDPRGILVALIERRNRKTRLFHAQLLLLLMGLSSYVVGVIAYLLIGRL